MPALPLGLIIGVVSGIMCVLVMLPLDVPNKTTALVAAFISQLGLGLVTATVAWPIHPVLTGLILGLLLNIPDALIAKAFPIIGMGAVFGMLCGGAVSYFRA